MGGCGLNHPLITAIHGNLRSGCFCKQRATQFSCHFCDVMAGDFRSQDVFRFVLLYAHTIMFGTRFEHVIRPDAGVEDRVRMQDVDADAVAGQLEGRDGRRRERVEAAEAAGVKRDRLWIDPGIGFAKTASQSLVTRRILESGWLAR